MTVFKTFWKVVSKYKGTIILYTVMLIVFGGLNMSSNNTDINFTNSKPDILIINKDEEKGLTKNLINYMKLEYTDGCVCTSLTIDGKETIDMNVEDFKSVIHKLIDKENDLGTLQHIWIVLMEQQGKYEDLGQCEECGDYITKYTLEI